jgi:hypothetical protein
MQELGRVFRRPLDGQIGFEVSLDEGRQSSHHLDDAGSSSCDGILTGSFIIPGRPPIFRAVIQATTRFIRVRWMVGVLHPSH